jgi:predicted dehydrogenase
VSAPVVRVAVVGAGNMGLNHARVYGNLKGVELVAVVDPDLERARDVCGRFGGLAVESLGELHSLGIDAASVAVPSSLHRAVGVELLAKGVHCLVEKPLAPTPAEARELVAAASDAGAVLLVGHVERFNPAVHQLAQILADGPAILAVDARRMSAVSSRITDVDVIADLMIHDIEVVMHLVPADVVDVVARRVAAEGHPGSAYVTALLTFANGTLASVTASRITQNQVRELQVTTGDRLYVVDYSQQELRIYRQGRIGDLPSDEPSQGQYVLDVGTERVFVRRTEPLAAELAHFLACVRGQEEPRVSGERAVRAIEVAAQVAEAVGRQ